MSKNKYCYAVVDKENGRLLSIDTYLPIYIKKEDAKLAAKDFYGFIVHPILLEDMERFILNPDRVNYYPENFNIK